MDNSDSNKPDVEVTEMDSTVMDSESYDDAVDDGFGPVHADSSMSPTRPSSLASHRLDLFSLSCGLLFAIVGVLALLQQGGAISPSPGEVGAVLTAGLAVIVLLVIAVIARRSLAVATDS